jgi:hypothetical protein
MEKVNPDTVIPSLPVPNERKNILPFPHDALCDPYKYCELNALPRSSETDRKNDGRAKDHK